MKAFAIFFLFLGIILVIQAYYKDKTTCSVPKTIIKYVPRSIYEDQLNSEERLAEFYKVMFDGSEKNKSLFDDLQNNRGMNNRGMNNISPTDDNCSVYSCSNWNEAIGSRMALENVTQFPVRNNNQTTEPTNESTIEPTT